MGSGGTPDGGSGRYLEALSELVRPQLGRPRRSLLTVDSTNLRHCRHGELAALGCVNPKQANKIWEHRRRMEVAAMEG